MEKRAAIEQQNEVEKDLTQGRSTAGRIQSNKWATLAAKKAAKHHKVG